MKNKGINERETEREREKERWIENDRVCESERHREKYKKLRNLHSIVFMYVSFFITRVFFSEYSCIYIYDVSEKWWHVNADKSTFPFPCSKIHYRCSNTLKLKTICNCILLCSLFPDSILVQVLKQRKISCIQ